MLTELGSSGSQRDEALLSWVQQSAPYGIVTLDESFQVQTWNHWMGVHSGKQPEEVVGKNLFALFPDLQERKLVAHFERALQGESSVLSSALHHYLLPLPSPFRESTTPLMLQTARIAPLFSDGAVCGIVLVIEDVTQRESQAEALNRQHRRDELLAWALAHLLKTEEPRKAVRQLFFKIAEHLDFDTFFIYLRDLETGHLKLEAVGGIPQESEADFFTCPFPAIAGDESERVIVLNSLQACQDRRYSALKKARISAALAIPLVADDRSLGLICFASCSRDFIAPDETQLVKTISQYLATSLDKENTSRQLRNAKEQLAEHAQLLEIRVQERTSRLQDTISELETFSYTIAHDLRAPARAVTGYCEVLLEDFAGAISPDARTLVERIGRASRRMEALTRDLLEFSRVSRQQIVLSDLEIEPIIEELAALRVPAVREAITVRRPLHRVRGHRDLLQQVLSNLVDNAIKFVKPGAAPKITISSELLPEGSPNTLSGSLIFSATGASAPGAARAVSERGPRHVRIWIEDEGIGVHPRAHQKIFSIFERGARAGNYEGTGIGLAIVARAMQRMGGTCGVESELNKGSRFWLELPYA